MGYVVQGSSKFRQEYYIYNDPSNEYEHFIERYYRKNCQAGKTKQAIIHEAQIYWKQFLKANRAELRQYLKLRWGEKPITRLPKQQAQTKQEQVRDFGFRTVCNPSQTVQAMSDDQLMEECSSTSASASLEVCSVAYPSAAVAVTDKGRYVQDKHRCQVHKFVTVLCTRVVNDILSEDML